MRLTTAGRFSISSPELLFDGGFGELLRADAASKFSPWSDDAPRGFNAEEHAEGIAYVNAEHNDTS